MSAIQFSDPMVLLEIEKNREKLSTYTEDLDSLEFSKQENDSKTSTLQRKLKNIEADIAVLVERKNGVLKDLNDLKVTGNLLNARARDLSESIKDLESMIYKLENQPIEKSSKTTRRGAFLRRMDHVLPWPELKKLVEPNFTSTKSSSDPNEIEQMLRIYFLQQWFNLSNIALEETLYDSMSMRDFVGAHSKSQQLPDHEAIDQFRKMLEVTKLDKMLQVKMQTYLKQNGLLLSVGSIIDASVTSMPKPVQPKPEELKGKPVAPVKKNKYSFMDYLATYGEPKKLITEIVTEFHGLVVEKKETRHYLFNANIDNIISDQIHFVSYVFPKERITQSNPIVQTAPKAMRVAISTFDEIANMLSFLLIDYFRFERKSSPTAAAHIIELVEETRCQIEDTNQTVWKPIELKADLLENFFSMQGFISRSVSEQEVALVGGLDFPINVIIDRTTRNLVLKATCKANDWASLGDLEVIKDTLNEGVKALNFEVAVIDLKPVLVTEYYLPYNRGVPNRMLYKVCKSFATAIAAGLALDEANLMVKPST